MRRIGVLILVVMYRRRDGLFGRAELDEVLLRWRRRREAAGGTAPPGNAGAAVGDAT